jgi:hypothetical protein
VAPFSYGWLAPTADLDRCLQQSGSGVRRPARKPAAAAPRRRPRRGGERIARGVRTRDHWRNRMTPCQSGCHTRRHAARPAEGAERRTLLRQVARRNAPARNGRANDRRAGLAAGLGRQDTRECRQPGVEDQRIGGDQCDQSAGEPAVHGPLHYGRPEGTSTIAARKAGWRQAAPSMPPCAGIKGDSPFPHRQ